MAQHPTRISFTHKQVGRLDIDTGIDDIQWGYNLNTQTFPTYGGEVVQILSVYIDDLTVSGTVATYAQMEAIYSYFAAYLQVATQGRNAQPSDGKSAYNLYPVYFSYPERNWVFKIYPKGVPGFRYARDVAAPTWQISAHVVDDSPDLALIKDGIKALAGKNVSDEDPLSLDKDGLKLQGLISPGFGNPDTDPFETFAPPKGQTAPDVIKKYSDYYNSLISSYSQGDFAALTNGIGSKPNTTPKNASSKQNTPTVTPGTQNSGSSTSAGKSPAHTGGTQNTGGIPHNDKYNKQFKAVFDQIWSIWHANNQAFPGSGCSAIESTVNGYVKTVQNATDPIIKQAIFDALDTFNRSPYSCGLIQVSGN